MLIKTNVLEVNMIDLAAFLGFYGEKVSRGRFLATLFGKDGALWAIWGAEEVAEEIAEENECGLGDLTDFLTEIDDLIWRANSDAFDAKTLKKVTYYQTYVEALEKVKRLARTFAEASRKVEVEYED